MSRLVRLSFLIGGLAGFVYLIGRTGATRLLDDAARTGWMFIPILLVYGVSYFCNAWAWQVVMAEEPSRPPFPRTYAITVSAFSLDFVTPMINLGGEPFRIAAAAPWLGPRRALGGVVLYKLLHALSLVVTWLAALLLAFFLLPHHPMVVGALLTATAAVAALTLFLLRVHRRGGVERLLDLSCRLPLVRRAARKLEPHREVLRTVDQQITEFYHRSPGRFFRALGLECLGRCAYMAEYYLIFVSLGLGIGYAQAFLVGGLSSLILNATFFVPFEVGTKEGSHYLLFQLLGLDPGLGVYTAMVSRARDLAWIALGLSLVWFSAGGRARADA